MDEAELQQRLKERETRLRGALLNDDFGEASSVLDDANFGGVVADKVGFLRAGALAEWTRPLVGNQPLNPASPDWQGIKDGVTRNYFKKPNAAGVTDQQFHELVKADIQTRDSALEKARNDALAGIGLVTGLSAFSQGAAQSPVKGKFFTYQGEYQKAYSQVSQRVEPYRDTINEASRILSSELDREVADAEAFRKVADMLIAVPEKDRPIVLNAIGVTGGMATGDTKAYSEKLFASFDRMLGSLAAGGESLFESVATSVGLTEAAAGLAPADTEAAFQTEARRREYDILKNMVRQTAYGEVSPVQGDGWLEETGIGLAAMAPLTLAAFVPYAGQAAMVGYFRDDTAANLMRDNPGMTAAQADSIATVAAPFMAAVETVANKIPFGKVPAVEQFFRSQVTSLKTAATRFGARTVLGTGAEIAEESVQQMLPVAFQELATALNADIPGVDWEREVERLKEMPAQVFGPALIMSMIGAGGVSITEVRNGRALAQNVDLLVANGNSPEQAQRIVEAGQKQDWAQVDAIIRDGFSKPQATPEQRQAAIQSFTSKINKTQAAVKSLEVNGQIASIRRAADGWALIGIDGTQTAKFQSFEEADGARWADAKQRNLNLHAAMREYITQMDSRLGENQENIIRFNPEKLSVETAVERGMVTQEAIDTRVAAMRALDEGRMEEKEYSAANAEANIEGDNEPVLTILGTNYLEFKDGVSRGVIDLYQGATLHDLVEEMAEVSVKRLGVRKNKSKLIADLRDAEAKIQEVERRMGDEPSLLFRSANDAELTDADVIEAFSHVAKSYFTNEALRSDTAKGWQAKNKNTRRYLTQLRKGVTESGAFRWIQMLGRKLGSIFQRASAIDAVRGQFKGDLETLIRQAVGLDSQDTFDQQTIEEAQTLAREAGVGGEVSMSVTEEEDSAYLAAVERGDMETAQRMVDEASKKAGYDVGPLWHGTRNPSQPVIFDTRRQGQLTGNDIPGTYFTNSRAYSANAAGERFGNGSVNRYFLKLDKMANAEHETNARYLADDQTTKVDRKTEHRGDDGKKYLLHSRSGVEVRARLEKQGFNGVYRPTATADEWIAFEPSQIKSADPVTYDDAGNVIPLSQRFNSERPEITFSLTAEEDSDYLAAVERGDMETAQRLVDAAAKAAGYDTYTWYHGGTLDSEKDPIPRIKEGKKSKSNMQLDFGLHLAKDRNESLAYARSKNGRVNAVYLAKGDGLVLDLSNDAPWIVTSEIGQKFGSKISKAIEKQRQQNKAFGAEVDIVTGEVPVYPAQIEPILTSLPPKEVYDALRSAGYSGVQYTAKANYGTGWYRTFEAITVIGSPNQVKLADPVTYDDAGNVIPLSQRFNPERPEITFSLTKGDLQTRLAAMFDPFQRDPVMRRKIGLAAAQRVQKVAREALFSVAGSGVNKNTMERLEAERLKALSKMKDDAPDWVKKRLQTPTTPEQVRAEVQKDRLLVWLRTLNAAVSSLPLEVRSRILQGGTMKIASLKSNEARLRAVEEIIKKADRHLEAYLRKEITAEIDKLTERYKSTRKDAGQMAGKLISTATEQVDYLAAFRDLDEKQQEDTIAALEKTIEEDDNADSVQDALNKLGIAELFFNEQKQSAEQLNNALEWLQSTIELGRQGKKVLDEERKQFIGSLKTAALDSVLAGDEASLIAAENKDANVSATTLKKSVDLLKGIYYEVIPTTLQQLEMTFGEDSAIANHFRDRIIEATNQATDIKRKIERDRVQAMAEIFGTKSGIAQVIAMKRLQKVRKSGVMVNEGRKTEDMRLDADILQRLSDGAVQAADLGLTEAQVADALDEFAANPRTRGVTIEKVTNAGKMVELEMSEAQGIQYLFSWNQPDVQERMRRQGWDESTIAQLNEFLSPEAKALAAWMSEQYAQGADLIDPVYRRLFNAPMPRNKNYAPTFYNVSGSANVTPLDAGQQSSGISAGFTKARRAHNAPLKRVDSLVAFLSHWEHVSHWVAFSELVRDMKAVLADNTVQAAIATKISRPAADKLKTRIKSIESQGNNQAWALFAMDGFFARLNQARAFKGLAYRISPIIKQTSAILNPLLADVPAPAYFMRLGKLLTGNLDVSAMWRSDAINRRIDSGFSPEFRMAQQGAGVNGSVAVALMQRGMLPMSYTDAGWNTLGAAIAFDYYRSQAIKSMGDNVNMEAAEAAATKAVDRMLAVAAQPSELVNRALVEGSPNPFTKAAWMFASESRKTLAIELAAINRLIKGKSKNKAMDVQRIMVAHFLMGAVTQLMSGFYSFLLGDEEDREREWSSEQWAAALLSGPINGLFVLGDVMGMLVRRAVGAEVWQASGSALMKAANDFWRGAANIDDLFSDDPEEIKAEIDRLSGAMGTITAGLVGPQAMALDVVLGNPLRDIEKARKRVTEEE